MYVYLSLTAVGSFTAAIDMLLLHTCYNALAHTQAKYPLIMDSPKVLNPLVEFNLLMPMYVLSCLYNNNQLYQGQRQLCAKKAGGSQ